MEATFYYVKSTHFRVIHTDGVIGGVTPQGLLHVAVFSERQAIPERTVHEVNVSGTTGTLGKEIERHGKDGIIRELEADLMMDIGMAKRLHKWLGERLTELDSPRSSPPPSMPSDIDLSPPGSDDR